MASVSTGCSRIAHGVAVGAPAGVGRGIVAGNHGAQDGVPL